jgi:hypothetical protein
MIENGGSIGSAAIGKLSTRVSGINLLPVDFQQFLISGLVRVKGYLYGFNMTRVAITDLFITGFFSCSSGIACNNLNDPGKFTNGGTIHQKQPPANVANCSPVFISLMFILCIFQ